MQSIQSKYQYRIAQYPGADSFPFRIGPALVEGSFDEHTHDFCELVIILSGSGRQMVNGRSCPVKTGDIFVCNLGASHGFTQARALRMVNIMYAPSLLASIGPDLRALHGFQAMFVIGPSNATGFRCMMKLDSASLHEVEHMAERMHAEFSNQPPGFQTLIQSLLVELVVFLSRRCTDQAAGVEGPAAALRLARTAAHMNALFREQLSIDSLASHAGLSRRHFIRLFKRIYGTTPLHYILSLRLQHAASLLTHSTRSVTRVSFESGFTDSNYFIRQFRSCYGNSPGAYRANRTGSSKPAKRSAAVRNISSHSEHHPSV